jgi:gephyrin
MRTNALRQAITPLIDRHAPGLVHLMMSSSLTHTPLAALSRPVAGTIKDTLVVTLPGSVKAVKENLNALLSGGVLQHAIQLIKGDSGKDVHAVLAKSSLSSLEPGESTQALHNHSRDHHHHHHHHGHEIPQPRTVRSNDPNAPGMCLTSQVLKNSPDI